LFTFTLDSGVAAVNDPDVIVLLQFPAGWDISTISNIIVDLQSADSYTPSFVSLTNSYAPIVYFTADNKDYNTSAATVTVSGLKNPSPVGIGTGSGVIATLTGATSQSVAVSTTNSVDAQLPYTIETVGVSVNIKEASFPAAHYTFVFDSHNAIPANGKI